MASQQMDSDKSSEDSLNRDRLGKLIQGFLERHQFLHEYRLQKLVYLAELLYVERTGGDRLTGADYKPYRYGAYSEDVKSSLQEEDKRNPEIQSEYDRKYGNDTWTYKTDGLEPELDSKVEEVVDVVMKLSRRKSNDDLAKWSKSTYLFKETRYDEEMDFSEYVDEYLGEGNKADWKKLL